MKTGNWSRILGVWMLLGAIPVTAAAALRTAEVNSVSINVSFNGIDSIPKSRVQDDKDAKKPADKDRKKGADADKSKDPKVVEIDPKRPNIKEIPRARPKLRPGTVTDKVKIKRPPVRVKPGRGLRVGL